MPGYPSGVTHWRRLRFWKRQAHLRQAWRKALNVLVMAKRLRPSVLAIDGTLIPSHEFKERTGYSGKHRQMGTKLSLLVEGRGTPLAVSLAPGNVHDVALAYLTVTHVYRPPPILKSLFKLVETEPPVLLGDKGHDSRQFRQYVAEQGYQPDIPKRANIPIEPGTEGLYAHDPVKFKERYVVERTNSWLKSFRRLRYRVDRATASFEAFVYLAVIVICVRKGMN